ncbi:hypothetical protein, partial [Myxococcus sp. RHSTA-1-4]|uniref:hypothetical protein n=1 Tax=Myxococcus sp. RHSTA-1-4 TaxID=2874601 RepID=UPI001CC14478
EGRAAQVQQGALYLAPCPLQQHAPSPATSIAHGLFEAMSEALPALDDLLDEGPALFQGLRELLEDVLPTTPDEVSTALVEAGVDPSSLAPEQIDAIATSLGGNQAAPSAPPASEGVRFSGFDSIEAINDSQGSLPTCFPETVENIIQLYQGDAYGIQNELAQLVSDQAQANGWTNPKGIILHGHHQDVFQMLGIPTELVAFNSPNFSFDYFKAHLDAQCPIQLGVDPADFGNPGPNPHSVTLVDAKPDAQGRWFYRVLDSANPQTQWYPVETVERSARSAWFKWNDGHNGSAIICKQPALRWPFRT